MMTEDKAFILEAFDNIRKLSSSYRASLIMRFDTEEVLKGVDIIRKGLDLVEETIVEWNDGYTRGLKCIGNKGCGYEGPFKEFEHPAKNKFAKCPKCGKSHTFMDVKLVNQTE